MQIAMKMALMRTIETSCGPGPRFASLSYNVPEAVPTRNLEPASW
jgi:hypothetical protein